MRLVVLILLFYSPGTALANEVVQGVGLILTFVPGWQVVGYILLIASAYYGSEQARRAAAAQREAQRQAYNAGLRDRTITRVATDAPHRYIYGRARVGSDIVAMFTSGTKDEYRWLVCIHAAHECDAIEEIYIGGKALGTLDANGDVTTGDYANGGIVSVGSNLFFNPYESFTGTSHTLAHPTVVPASVRVIDYNTGLSVPYTLSSGIVSVSTYGTYNIAYDYTTTTPRVRVTKHLGTPTETADAALVAAFPTLWTSNSVLRGYCYTVIRLDLNQPEFQSGIPPIEALIRGKKLYDPRDGTTTWKSNPALAIYDFLTGEMCGIASADIPVADYITAANVCDESITIGGLSVAKYTINGTITADQDPAKVLESLAQCMAGGIVKTTWSCWAGKYIAPVMVLDQSDIVGALSVISGTPDADLYNGVRGQYIGSENSYVVTDFKPFQNATYVTADGRELWTNIDFPFTDSAQRIHNLARIFCEDQRNGFTLQGAFSLKTWALKVGQRVTFTSAFLGQSAKVYRLTDKKFGPDQAVELTLKEDASTIWDLADAVTVDETPNTNLPNPWMVAVPGNVQMTEELYSTTGSVGVRVKAIVTWDAPANVTVIEYELEYKPYASGLWVEIPKLSGERCEILDIQPGMYDFRVKAKNILGVFSQYTAIKTFTVFGLLTPPENVTGFSITPMAGVAYASWNETTSLDVKIGGKLVVRFCPLTVGATWGQSYILEEFNGSSINGTVPLATGTYYAKFIDSTGHYSAAEASFIATEALVTGWTTVATSTQHPTFAGTKTNVAQLGGFLQLDSIGTIGGQSSLISTWGYIGSLGGIQPSGTYEFDAVLDLSSVASRRFHAHIKSYSYDTGDTVSQRGLVSTWPSIAGDVVNDCDVTAFASVSENGINFGPWTPFMVADFYCRYAKFKVELSSMVNTHNIQLSELSVAVKTTP